MRLRLRVGLTQQTLAERLGVDRSLVRYYERTATNPKMTFVLKCAAALKVAPKHLLPSEETRGRPLRGPAARWDRILERALKNLHPRKLQLFFRLVESQLEMIESSTHARTKAPVEQLAGVTRASPRHGGS